MTSGITIPSDYGAKRRLVIQPEAVDLVTSASGSEGRTIRLSPTAASAWKKMRDSASGEGLVLLAITGFRSRERQAEIIQNRLQAGEELEAVLNSIVAPGYSEHHSGCAIDIGIPDGPALSETFEQTQAFRWLQSNASEFGFRMSFPKGNFHGIAYKPWHWLFEELEYRTVTLW